MSIVRRLLSRFGRLLRLRHANAEVSDEIRIHLELATEANLRAGMTADEARAQAEREFGNPAAAGQTYRDALGFTPWLGWGQDLQHTLKSLRRAKVFVAVTVGTLALGIGSAAAIFSLVDYVLFRSVDYPDGVVLLGGLSKDGAFNGARFQVQLLAYREQARTLEEIAAAKPFEMNIDVNGEPVTHGVISVTPNLFPLLGVQPSLGRNFVMDDFAPNQALAAIITHKLWREAFRGDPNVLGQKLTLNHTVCVIVGVLAARQLLPPNLRSDVFIPLYLPPTAVTPDLWYLPFARMRPGVTREQVDRELAGISAPLPPTLAPYIPYNRPHVQTMRELHAVEKPVIFWVLVGAVTFLYATACLNAANLMTLRLLRRRREMSIRLALGGGHWRLVRLMFLEAAVLAMLAAAFGVLLANWLGPLLRYVLDPSATLRWAQWSLDPRTLGILAGVTAVTMFSIAFVPALRVFRATAFDGLKDGGVTVGQSPSFGGMRQGLVVAQTMVAVVLLTGAGLMVRTLIRLQQLQLGYDESHLVRLQLGFSPGFGLYSPQAEQRLNNLRNDLSRVAGVIAVGYGSDNLLTGKYADGIKLLAPSGSTLKVQLDLISPDYLATGALTLKHGQAPRPIGAEMLINESLARALFGTADPVGQQVRVIEGGDGKYPWNIVGVVGDVRDRMRERPGYHIYGPASWYSPGSGTYLIRTAAAPSGSLLAQIRRAVHQHNPGLIVLALEPMHETRLAQTKTERFVTSVLQILSVITLCLAAVGLFSLLTYAVDQRRGEFAVRVVLGATPNHLAGLVLRSTALMVGCGLGLGIAGALALGQLLRSVLYETSPQDPVALGTAIAAIAGAALVASLVPALRAARTHVAELLRAE